MAEELLPQSNIKQLFSPLSKIKEISIPYLEKRESFFYKEAKKYKGTITYIFPDTFIKTISGSERQQFEITGEQLIIKLNWNSETKQYQRENQIPLNSDTKMLQFKALLSGLLSGQTEALEEYYDMKLIRLNDLQLKLLLTAKHDPFVEQIQQDKQTVEVVIKHTEQLKSNHNGKPLPHIQTMIIQGSSMEKISYTFLAPDIKVN
ncbi:MAG: hypothetical protein HQL46_00255 [Gammaproteobacteria bacterium]|nr:hypothetical protein [Gammaproteobacteria bacterium]